MQFKKWLSTALLSAALVLAAALPAQASNGLYVVMACANPDTGQGVMSSNGVLPAGFTAQLSRTVGAQASAANCGPGAMTVSRGVLLNVGVPFTTNTPGDGIGSLTFRSPPGTQLVEAFLYRNGTTGSTANHMSFSIHSGAHTDIYNPTGVSQCSWVQGCASLGEFTNPWSGPNYVWFGHPLADGFSVTVGCDIPDSTWVCNASSATAVRLFGGKLVLRDEAAPQASGELSGELATQDVVRGDADVTVNATDAGAGVYRIRLLVDDVVALARVVDENGGKCVDVNAANTDPYEFADPVPCRASAGGTYTLDTRTLSEGSHNVKVVVEDAAGNAATLANRSVVVDNVADAPAALGAGTPGAGAGAGGAGAGNGAGGGAGVPAFDRGALNGAGASDRAVLSARWATTTRATKRSAYGKRHVVQGRLVDEHGRSIRNARVELFATARARGARPVAAGTGQTRDDGSWSMALSRGVSSRRLEFRYRSHVNDLTPAATAALQLRVTAGVRLAIAPRLARRGSTIRLRGQLLGRPVPRQGKIIELQARTAGHRWVTFRTVRTSKRGVFTTRYRFRRGGPVTYYLRVRARSAGDYPFDTGSSSALPVRVR